MTVNLTPIQLMVLGWTVACGFLAATVFSNSGPASIVGALWAAGLTLGTVIYHNSDL